MLESFYKIIFMDGNGHFVWFCLVFLILVLSLNIIYAIRKKRKILGLIQKHESN